MGRVQVGPNKIQLQIHYKLVGFIWRFKPTYKLVSSIGLEFTLLLEPDTQT